MSDDIVNIEIDGVPRTARKGQMIIEVTDAIDTYVPRFCYHEKLSIAANCRMCLVEVEKVPKPLPACATPVAEGMKIFTRSDRARAAQKATMEFLLINHPLDCPICDQGGECELQDLAMGFGRDASRYTERKRVIKDRDIGPLVSTDMTRCIYCTRCVRFGAEVAGVQQLGTIGRGEHTEVASFVGEGLDHELSGNVIDLCPVGALNSKPFRYQARSWEMTQQETVSPHDCVGSNLFAHVRRGRVMRIVPRANDEINETWISDRDRFSYEAIYSEDRLLSPEIKDGDTWRQVDWATALRAVVDGIRNATGDSAGSALGMLAGPSVTLEEAYLLARLGRGFGSENLDHRLRRTDFSDQQADPAFPSLGISLTGLEAADGILLIGSDIRREAPMLGHRVRKAAVAGARVASIGLDEPDVLFPLAASAVVRPSALVAELAAVAAALEVKPGPESGLEGMLRAAVVEPRHREIARIFEGAARPHILLGQLSGRHPEFGRLRSLVGAIAATTGSTFGFITEGGNGAGAALAGLLPHRQAAAEPVARPGLDAGAMLTKALRAYLLFGIEAELDTAAGQDVLAVLAEARFVACVTPFVSDTMREYARVLLPAGTFAETSGTYVNGEGRWQSVEGVARPLGESRPGWKILRVLGNLAGFEGFDYPNSAAVRDELKAKLDREPVTDAPSGSSSDLATGATEQVLERVPMYDIDPLVRRSAPLQASRDGLAVRRREWS
ncbi:MAG: NADH-quinone oxidoreductase subunit NuoG [Gammaproteobacteria bacterium]